MKTEPTEPSALSTITEAAGGMIRVTFQPNGLIESIHLDPRVKRLAVDELAEGLVEALGAAQQEILRQTVAANEARRAADHGLDEKCEAIYHDYLRQTSELQYISTEILKGMKE